ncbi:MAG: cysteine hydrolase [Candidatus Bathyarchaeia archaeon]
MQEKLDPSKTALLIIDMQNDLVANEIGPFSLLVKQVKENKVIENIAKLLKVARERGLPIFHIKTVRRANGKDVWPALTDASELLGRQVLLKMRESLIEGTYGAEFVDELKPLSTEYIIEKRRSDAFYQTSLELFLRRLATDTLILTGVITSGCVSATAIGARERDFNVIIVRDCCADMRKETHDFFVKMVFPFMGRVRTVEQIITSLS